jgi:hypothetical protein
MKKLLWKIIQKINERNILIALIIVLLINIPFTIYFNYLNKNIIFLNKFDEFFYNFGIEIYILFSIVQICIITYLLAKNFIFRSFFIYGFFIIFLITTIKYILINL